MATALVAIGVGKTNGEFHELKGAAQDAKEFHDWGVAQGFDCVLLADADRKVRVADVYEEINTFVGKGIYSQIVVYFSGHGVLQAPDCELWLMSGAPDNPNEVINVCGSIQAARSTGIEHSLRQWSDGQNGNKTFQQIQEELAEIFIPKVWINNGKNITKVAKVLSVSPKKIRRILRNCGHRDV